MVERLKDILRSGVSIAAGIHITLLADGRMRYDLVKVKMKKKEMTLIESRENMKEADEVMKFIDKHMPVCIAISGKGVILKRLESAKEVNISGILPNANADDFFVQHAPAANGLFAVFMREQLLHEVLSVFSEKKIKVYHLLLGPFILNLLIPLTDYKEFKISGYLLDIHDGIIDNITTLEKNEEHEAYNISDDKFEGWQMIPVAAALSFFAGNTCGIHSYEPQLYDYQNDFLYFRANKLILTGFLGLIFLVLMLNFMLYGNYSQKKDALQEKYATDRIMLQQLDELQEEYNKSKILLEKSGLSYDFYYSKYADRIASLLPEEIKLTMLQIHPVLEDVKDTKEITIEKGIILVKGEAKYSIVLNEWVNVLTNEPWTAKVNIINYEQESLQEPGRFEIQLIIKE